MAHSWPIVCHIYLISARSRSFSLRVCWRLYHDIKAHTSTPYGAQVPPLGHKYPVWGTSFQVNLPKGPLTSTRREAGPGATPGSDDFGQPCSLGSRGGFARPGRARETRPYKTQTTGTSSMQQHNYCGGSANCRRFSTPLGRGAFEPGGYPTIICVRRLVSSSPLAGRLQAVRGTLETWEPDHDGIHALEPLGVGYAFCRECGMAGSVCERPNLHRPDDRFRLTALAKAAG